MSEYDHKKIEKKWQTKWTKQKLYKTEDKNEKLKFYVLDMFPYPSGEGLHVGHPKGYIATDIISRMKRMQGFNVLHPMGFDAFGLPAENYAIKTKTNPVDSVKKNVKRFKEQLEIIGLDYDWSREINTTDPEYYKWTQWIFLKMFEKGLAYESFEPINWCPSCKTGLANEDVEDGKCERCGTTVEKKPMRQWVLKITDYAEKLLEGIDRLDWPNSIKEAQRNWIGKSEGSLIKFKIASSVIPANAGIQSEKKLDSLGQSADSGNDNSVIEVFTTRPDTIFGVTYVVVAPEHSLITEILNSKSQITNKSEIEKYLNEVKNKSEIERTAENKEKTGVELKGIKAVNPANVEEVPIFVADYVLGDYGTGAVMAVPAHDERDFAFAKKYNLSVRNVIRPRSVGIAHTHGIGQFVDYTAKLSDIEADILNGRTVYIKGGWLRNSGKFDGKSSEEVKKEITEFVGGKMVTKYKLRDWVFSRQRYWGEPIPIIYCRKCWEISNSKSQFPNKSQIQNSKLRKNVDYTEIDGVEYMIVPVPEKDLPVILPKVKSYEPTGTGESPLADISKWVNVKCPKCGGKGKRETNTMPQWAGSSWYYIAYCISENLKSKNLISLALRDPARQDKQISNSNFKNKIDYWLPIDFYVGGAEHATRHLIYARFWHKFLKDIGVVNYGEPFLRLQHVGLVMGEDGRKMSKRFGNVVNPDDVIEKLGADTLRVYEMFMGPFDAQVSWNTDGIAGARRFVERIWKLKDRITKHETYNTKQKTESFIHRTIKKVTEDILAMKFNTAVSALMMLLNEIEKEEKISRENFEIILKLIAPFAPHISEELWSKIGNKKSVHVSFWPIFDESKINHDDMTIVVQVNGKIRASFQVENTTNEEIVKSKSLELNEVKKWIDGKTVKKIIYVKGKLVSIVTE